MHYNQLNYKVYAYTGDPNTSLVVLLWLGVSQQSILAFAPRDPIVPFFGDWSMLPLWIHSFSTLNKYFTEIQLLYLIHERLNGNIRSEFHTPADFLSSWCVTFQWPTLFVFKQKTLLFSKIFLYLDLQLTKYEIFLEIFFYLI